MPPSSVLQVSMFGGYNGNSPIGAIVLPVYSKLDFGGPTNWNPLPNQSLAAFVRRRIFVTRMNHPRSKCLSA
jgi:hypothetical protein